MSFCLKKIGKTMILPFLPFGTPLNFMNKRKWIILMHKSVATAELCAKCRQHTLVPVFPSDFHMLIVGVSSAKNWGHCSGLIYARVPLQLKSKCFHSNHKPRPIKLLTKHWRTSKHTKVEVSVSNPPTENKCSFSFWFLKSVLVLSDQFLSNILYVPELFLA